MTTSSQVANNPILDANQIVDTGNLNGDGSAHIIDLTGESPKDELSDSESKLSEDNDFLVVTSEVQPPQPLAFTRLTPQTQAEVRPLLNIFRFCLSKVHIFRIGRLLKPFVHAHTQEIAGDGNCLFRVISYAVCNSEQYHPQVWREICNFIETYNHDLKLLIKTGEGKKYVESSGMCQLATWGTEVEILAAAKIIHRDVYTYMQGTWQRFACKAEKSADAMLENRSG